MAEAQDHDEREEERPPLGFGFAILLGSLLSLPLWAGIIWLAQWLSGSVAQWLWQVGRVAA